MQEKSIPSNRSPRPHPFWSTDVRKKPASKQGIRTRAGVQSVGPDSAHKQSAKKKAL